jgi:hypothetical protein
MWYLMVPIAPAGACDYPLNWLVAATARFLADKLTPTDLGGIVLDPAERENCDRGQVLTSDGVAGASP